MTHAKSQGPLFPDPAGELDRIINDVLLGKRGPWPVTDNQRYLLNALRYAKGSEHPIAISAIEHKYALSPRDIKAGVKSLVEDFSLPIGASRQEPYGYFLIVTPEDLEHALRPLQNEIISLGRRVRTLAGKERTAELFGQVRAELEGA